jgi:phosphoribosylformylglycinamidine cyclo-ligase
MKYADSGVNIDLAQRALSQAHKHLRSTWDERVLSDLGAFGGLFQASPGEPIMVASVDGVGTKVKVAAAVGRYDTIGQDLVNHCVNDILVQGAEPLFFLDYFAASKLEEAILPDVIAGLAKACRECGCALLGGETAEMPGVYSTGDFDLVGCIVGRVAAGELLDGRGIKPGDIIWGLPSTGLHTNGYTLARSILLEPSRGGIEATPPQLGQSIGEALLAVHRSYLHDVRAIWSAFGRTALHGLAHITGGGFYDNVPRVVPPGLTARIEAAAWSPPPIFRLIADWGGVPRDEMYRVFNMGVGMVAFTDPSCALDQIRGYKAVRIGEVEPDGGKRVNMVL